MKTAKEIAQTALMVILWMILIVTLLVLLLGCLGLEEKQEGRQQSLVVEADCDEDILNIYVDDDQKDGKKKIDLTK